MKQNSTGAFIRLHIVKLAIPKVEAVEVVHLCFFLCQKRVFCG